VRTLGKEKNYGRKKGWTSRESTDEGERTKEKVKMGKSLGMFQKETWRKGDLRRREFRKKKKEMCTQMDDPEKRHREKIKGGKPLLKSE